MWKQTRGGGGGCCRCSGAAWGQEEGPRFIQLIAPQGSFEGKGRRLLRRDVKKPLCRGVTQMDSRWLELFFRQEKKGEVLLWKADLSLDA